MMNVTSKGDNAVFGRISALPLSTLGTRKGRDKTRSQDRDALHSLLPHTSFLMPQLRESLAHYLHFQHIFSSLKDTSSFQVLSIWADIKQDEEEAYGTTDGNVVRLNDSCDIRRGGTGDKNLIWPPRCKPSDKSQLNLSDLELKGGEATPDSLILDFGPLWLSVRVIVSEACDYADLP